MAGLDVFCLLRCRVSLPQGRDINGARAHHIEFLGHGSNVLRVSYLEKRGIELEFARRRYSINRNKRAVKLGGLHRPYPSDGGGRNFHRKVPGGPSLGRAWPSNRSFMAHAHTGREKS